MGDWKKDRCVCVYVCDVISFEHFQNWCVESEISIWNKPSGGASVQNTCWPVTGQDKNNSLEMLNFQGKSTRVKLSTPQVSGQTLFTSCVFRTNNPSWPFQKCNCNHKTCIKYHKILRLLSRTDLWLHNRVYEPVLTSDDDGVDSSLLFLTCICPPLLWDDGHFTPPTHETSHQLR